MDMESINYFKIAFDIFAVCLILRFAHFIISVVIGVATIVYEIAYFLWIILLILFYSIRNSYRFLMKIYRDEVKNMYVKLCLTFLMFASLTGCVSVFKKPGDEPVKSPCEVCKKAPFYVNGKRV